MPTVPAGRFLSVAECQALTHRLITLAVGGGDTAMGLDSVWTGNARWGRNLITTSGDVRTNDITVTRSIRGAAQEVQLNQINEAALSTAVRRAEHLLQLIPQQPESELHDDYQEPYLHPTIWFDTTYQLDGAHRVAAVQTAVQPALAAGMLSAGYLAVTAQGRAVMNSRGQTWYYPYTTAQLSLTVRDPKGTGSGWAGVDWSDWSRVDVAHLATVALEKCLTSRNPVAIEPGRYTTILEPQAVSDLFSALLEPYPSMGYDHFDRESAERGAPPYGDRARGASKIGEQLLDARITVTADPMDPDLGFPPFDLDGSVYHPAVWFEHGVLKNLPYDREYGVKQLRINTGLPSNRAYRVSVSGETVSTDEMIATTKRGLLVTRFSDMVVIDPPSLLLSGYTRDGLWLIEDGKLSKPVKNFRFTESPLFAFNQVEQVGVPVRVFRPGSPTVVPPFKVQDFSFTSLSDAV